MTRRLVVLGLLVAVVLGACTRSPSLSGANAKPADLYAASLGESDIRTLLGDTNWWAGAPSFEVPPLDAATTPLTERFAITRGFIHIGTDEQLLIHYTVFDTVSSATAEMTTVKNALGASPTTPKVGDDVLYYGAAGGGGAPYATRTYVRLGQIVVTLIWTRKDPNVTVDQLGKNAAKVVAGLKNVFAAKPGASPAALAPSELPPAGLDITLLGSARLPIETWVVMTRAGLPGAVVQTMQGVGIKDFAFGDYALNLDTHMEVQTALIKFNSADDANTWASTFAGAAPDANGVANSYLPMGGTPAAGEYHYFFIQGVYGVMMVCKPSLDGEAASRECEDPLERTAIAWKFALGS
jgi:hypothetical protein